ncbi:hypothetical protein QL285_018088 [Trifolium repens]|nr:hypothetical protein QL285_018088 [Trifolium repens]
MLCRPFLVTEIDKLIRSEPTPPTIRQSRATTPPFPRGGGMRAKLLQIQLGWLLWKKAGMFIKDGKQFLKKNGRQLRIDGWPAFYPWRQNSSRKGLGAFRE